MWQCMNQKKEKKQLLVACFMIVVTSEQKPYIQLNNEELSKKRKKIRLNLLILVSEKTPSNCLARFQKYRWQSINRIV